jgi:hypothetical protein
MKRRASKRELIAPRGDTRYDAKGRIRESDDQGRSLAQDRRRKAKTAAKAGQGGGDRPSARLRRGRHPSGWALDGWLDDMSLGRDVKFWPFSEQSGFTPN